MVKTIKDIVLETYPVEMVKTYGYLPGGNITEKDANLLERMAMEKGANAVLEMLYHTAYKEDWITNPKDGVKRFFEIYKQLKGE